MDGARSEMDICRLGGLLCGGETIAATGATATGAIATDGDTTAGGGATTGTAIGAATGVGTAAILLSGSIGLIELVEPRGVIEGV